MDSGDVHAEAASRMLPTRSTSPSFHYRYAPARGTSVDVNYPVRL